MADVELTGGLRNAMERGYSLNRAIQSFINAGYNPQDVQAAAALLSQPSALPLVHPQSSSESETSLSKLSQPPQPSASPSKFSLTDKVKSILEGMDRGTKILIAGIIIILVLTLGAIFYLLLAG